VAAWAVIASAAVADGGVTRSQASEQSWHVSVTDFGAEGDGERDDTLAFQAAMEHVAEAGSGVVTVPPGTYRIDGNLSVPRNVTLEGVFRAPVRSAEGGSVLHAYAGRGEEDGEPFITLHENSVLKGIVVFYPEQTMPPVPYPWCVRGIGDNCTILDCLLLNPYQAVDFGTFPAGRHYIRGLYAQALYKGLFIDQCYDVGRVQDVHFWPFWRADEAAMKWTQQNATAFLIGRTDWEYFLNCFTIWYKVGFHFADFGHGPGNGVYTQSGADIGPTAVLVDAVQPHSGISFANSQFMSTVRIAESNRGPVKFTACGFWPIPETEEQAILEGTGHTMFTACHFSGWGASNAGVPAIRSLRGGLTVNGCQFMMEDQVDVIVEGDTECALIYGNRFHGGRGVITDCPDADLQIGLNSTR
jgi:hypothetical protein